MLTKNTYNELNDILGLPQIFNGISFQPIKMFEREKEIALYSILYKHEDELYDEDRYGFEGKKDILKSNTFLKKMIIASFYKGTESLLDCIRGIPYVLSVLSGIKEDRIGLFFGDVDNAKDIIKKDMYIKIKDEQGNDVVIKDYEFDELRLWLFKQNGFSIKYISTPYKKDLEDLLESENADSKISLSDNIFSFIAMSGMNVNDDKFKNYTLYQFSRHFYSLKQIKDYEVHYPMMVSGKIKNGINHYLAPYQERGRYDSILISDSSYLETNMGKEIGLFNNKGEK